MTRRRRDPESLIVDYFTTAEPEAAATLFRVIRGILQTRDLTVRKVPAKNGRPRTRRTTTTPTLPIAVVPDSVTD